MVHRNRKSFFPQLAMQNSEQMKTRESEMNLPAKAQPLTLYSGIQQFKGIYNTNTSNSQVNLIY
jgi:hypothetical protein